MKYVLENDIINLEYMQEQIDMKERKKYIEIHPYKIWIGNDEKWRTYLPDVKKDRRLIKRSTQKDIENVIVEYYRSQEEKLLTSFKAVYWRWRSVQDTLTARGNTLCKYDSDYRRYFENTSFENISMHDITEETIKVFLCTTIREKRLGKKAAKALFGYVKNTVKSARINKIIIDNPMEFLESKDFYKYCVDRKRPMENTIVTDEEMQQLYHRFIWDYENHPKYIPTYAVELATLTGFRVGEIAALKWDCITDDYILIDKSEKYDRKKKEYYIDKTKNGQDRIFPMTKEIQDLLDRVKKVAIKYGYICEWVFANEMGRVHAPMISNCARNKCEQIGIPTKGIHAYRRTVNSKMRCNGVSATIAASLMGHTQEVNEAHYTFDLMDISDKKTVVSAVNQQIKKLG